jgi:hypothetical protein
MLHALAYCNIAASDLRFDASGLKYDLYALFSGW